MSLSGQPQGVSASFDPVSTRQSNVKLKLTVDNQALKGKYRLTIRGSTANKSEETQLELNIQETGQADFSLQAQNISIKKGSRGKVNIVIKRTNSFAGLVNLSLSKKPFGVTGVFNPVSANNSSELSLNVANEVEAKDYNLTVTGQADGKTRTVNFVLTVEPKANNEGDFSLSFEDLPIKVGGSAKATVTINRTNGFAEAVALSKSQSQAGITAVFDPVSAQDSSEVTFSLEDDVPVGNHMLRIIGVADGKTRSVQFLLKVRAAGDNQSPHAISITPPHNKGGAAKDVNIVITFSEAMDHAKTEAAYSSASDGIKPNQVSFQWSANDTVLTINPNSDLKYKKVNDLNSLGFEYAWTLSNDATDLAGNKLINPLSHRFRTLREMTQKICAEKDGNVIKDKQVGGCLGLDLNHEVLCVGDTGEARANLESAISTAAIPANLPMRGFYSFNIGVLPKTLTEIKRATFYAYQKHGNINGDAYTDLKKPGQYLIIEHVFYGLFLTKNVFDTPVLHTIGNLSDNPRTGYKAVDVTVSLKDDYSKSAVQRFNKSQYRLRFALETDGDGTLDMVEFYSHNVESVTKKPMLVVEYLLP